MTDYQKAALEAGAREAKERWSMTACTGDDCVVWTGVSKAVIATAEPHLRRKWANEVREEKTRVTSIDVGWNRAFGMVVGLEIAAKLLEGADHD